MSYGHFHPLPPKPPKEKYAFGLNMTELILIIIGLILSYKLFKVVKPLPFVKNLVLVKIHAFTPLAICAFFAFGKHPKTGIGIGREIVNAILFNYRNKVLIYRKWKNDA